MGHDHKAKVRDEQVKELHLSVYVADMVPPEYMPVETSFDSIVVHLEWSNNWNGRPVRRTIRIPVEGF